MTRVKPIVWLQKGYIANPWMTSWWPSTSLYTVSGRTAMKRRGRRVNKLLCKLIFSLGEFFTSLDIFHEWDQGILWFRGSTCISLCCHQPCGAFLMSLFKMCIKTGKRNSRRQPVLHWSEQESIFLLCILILIITVNVVQWWANSVMIK